MEFVWHFLVIVLVNANVKGIIALNISWLQNHSGWKNSSWKGLHGGPQSNLVLKAGPTLKSFIYKVVLPYTSRLEQ